MLPDTIVDILLKYGIPFLTSLGVIVAILAYVITREKNKAAYINSLFETIKLNLKIRQNVFFPEEKNEKYIELGKILQKLGKYDCYPNPTDNEKQKKKLFAIIDYDGSDDLVWQRNNKRVKYFPLLFNSIKTIFESGYCHRILNKRIVINLGHLYYSLERNNLALDTFNQLISIHTFHVDKIPSEGFKLDYFMWVHFRQYFMILDLVNLYPKRYFTDKAEYDRLKKMLPISRKTYEG